MTLVVIGDKVVNVSVDGYSEVSNDTVIGDKVYDLLTNYDADIQVNGTSELVNSDQRESKSYDINTSSSYTVNGDPTGSYGKSFVIEGTGTRTVLSVSDDNFDSATITWEVYCDSGGEPISFEVYYGSTRLANEDDVDDNSDQDVTVSGSFNTTQQNSDFYINQDNVGLAGDTGNYNVSVDVHINEVINSGISVGGVTQTNFD